jgi:subtilisin family serine protease
MMTGTVRRERAHGLRWQSWGAPAARRLALLMVAGLLLQDGSVALSADKAKDKEEANPGKDVVVVLPDNVDADKVLADLGIDPTYQYEKVVNGFAAKVSAADKEALQNIPGAIVSPNRKIVAFDRVKAQGKHKHKHKHKNRHKKKHNNNNQTPPPPSGPPPQVIPTGISRIAATQNPQAGIAGDGGAIDVDVAVLDTGIGPNSDLTIMNIDVGQDCVGAGTTLDGDGHGTHVSGTIGALDNTIGVVGVAPGARLYPVKVLDDFGGGDDGTVMCGLEWVLANAGTIDVVNMSLGGDPAGAGADCDDNALHRAVCNVVEAGIPVIVAAGNDGEDAAGSSPANYDQVITVSALTDFNGASGGGASPTCFDDGDDTFADYSNFGNVVDIMAPGSCILSTAPGEGLDTLSGTSMATPHVTGAAALYRASHPGATPAAVKAYLIGSAGSVAQNSANGLVSDFDPNNEPVLFIPSAAP